MQSQARVNARFATTQWSLVHRAASPNEREALGKLIESYWYPLYAFARRRGHVDHDAMDLTQGFFAHLLSSEALGSASPDRGRFRSFLLTSFTNYIANQRRAASALRRGGSRVPESLSDNFKSRYDLEPATHETPERLYERRWAEELLARVWARLAEEYRVAGKSPLLELLEPHLICTTDAMPRSEIGKKLNLTQAAVAMSLYRIRRRYGDLVREEVAATVKNPSDVEDELRFLMEVAGQGE